MASGVVLKTFIVLAVLSFARADDLVREGVYGSRGGSIVLEGEDAATDSVLMFFDPSNYLSALEGVDNGRIEETSVSAALSKVMGIQSPSKNGDFPAEHEVLFSEKPRAVAFIGIEGLSTVDVGTNTPGLNGAVRKLELRPSSYPFNAMTSITNILTGQTPTSHGVVAESWTSGGVAKKAYNGPLSGSARGNLADVFAQTFNGESLALAAAADEVHAKAISAQLADGEESSVMLWVKDGQVQSNPAGLRDGVDALPALREVASSISESDKEIEITVGKEKAVFKMVSAAFVTLQSDLQAAATVASFLKKRDTRVVDSVPDLFTVEYSSLPMIEAEYGSGSPQAIVAFALVDGSVKRIVGALNEAYGERFLAAVAGLGRPRHGISSAAEETTRSVLAGFGSVKGPMVYTSDRMSVNALERMCNELHSKLTPAGVKAHCVGIESSFLELLELNPGQMRTMDFMASSDTSRNVTSFEIIEYQTFFWTWVILGLILLASLCMMANMPLQKDTLLYPAGEFEGEFEKKMD